MKSDMQAEKQAKLEKCNAAILKATNAKISKAVAATQQQQNQKRKAVCKSRTVTAGLNGNTKLIGKLVKVSDEYALLFCNSNMHSKTQCIRH